MIDQLVGELEEARDYLKSEEERIRAATARYTALTQAASASVKVIFDALAIAIAAVLPGQCDGVGSEPLFVFTAPRYLALRRTVLSERRTGAPLGDMHDRLDLLDTGATTRGA